MIFPVKTSDGHTGGLTGNWYLFFLAVEANWAAVGVLLFPMEMLTLVLEESSITGKHEHLG